jgi:hypothetical protein
MVANAVFLRAGDAGPEVQGPAGAVLTMQADGRVKAVTPTSAPGAVRASWAISTQTSAVTFEPGAGPTRNVVTEPAALTGLTVGMRFFVQPDNALQGFFHSATPAPQLGGVYDVLETDGDSSATLQRSADMTTAAQIAAVALIAVDDGSGKGLYQVATPPAAVVDTDPQVMPMVSAQLGVTTAQVLKGFGGEASWADGLPVPTPPTTGLTYVLQYDNGTGLVTWVVTP